jgi:hypothetical protein
MKDGSQNYLIRMKVNQGPFPGLRASFAPVRASRARTPSLVNAIAACPASKPFVPAAQVRSMIPAYWRRFDGRPLSDRSAFSMSNDGTFLSPRRLLLTSFFWPVLGALYFALMGLDQKHLGQPGPGLNILAVWVEWGVLTPWVIRRAMARPPFGPQAASAWRFHLRSLLGAVVGLALLNNVGRLLLTRRITDLSGSFGGIFLYKLSVATAYGLIIYLTTASLVWFVVMQEQTKRRRLSLARLEAELAGEQLATLKMRLRPDLVVRVLRKAAILSGTDCRAAEEAIHRLSDLVREVLSQSRAASVELSTEIDSFENYLCLLALAAGREIDVRRRIRGAGTGQLPPRILQMAAEDVEVVGAARVRVLAVTADDRLSVRVRMSGFRILEMPQRDGGRLLAELPGWNIQRAPLPNGLTLTVSTASTGRASRR